MIPIVMVLRSGGEYGPEHVERLRDQIEDHLPGADVLCISDVAVPCRRLVMRHPWPGWWSKLNLFDPVHAVLRGGFLYLDLDTTICGDLSDIAAVEDLTLLSDFYRPHKVQSSLMRVTPEAAVKAWGAFLMAPERTMRDCTTKERWGDQGFLEGVWGQGVARFQDRLPGQVVSWKVDCVPAGATPRGARIIIHHGRPRPWDL